MAAAPRLAEHANDPPMTPPMIEQYLAAHLRNEPKPWPDPWEGDAAQAAVVEEILYHGVAGLLADRAGGLKGWPDAVVAATRQQAIAQAMWEMRHREVLADLLAALGEEGIVPLFLKGTAMAYDLYETPANRSRGDTDLLVGESDIQRARTIFNRLGYRLDHGDGVALQEAWTLSYDDGTRHPIDLHAQVMNAPALQDVLSFEECAADSIPLPRLSAEARGLDRARALVHNCMHRAMHLTAPYLVDGRTYYGADRLIWIHDIQLLARAFSAEDWRRFCTLSRRYGAAAVCLDGLRAAQRTLGADIPDDVCAELSSAPRGEKASHYLLRSRQLGRAWQDLRAIRGIRRKLAYARSRIWPSQAFVRSKYGDGADKPAAQLRMRRLLEFLRPRPQRDGKR